MKNKRVRFKKLFLWTASCVLFIAFAILASIIFFDKVVSFTVNNFTDIDVSYEKWGDNIFDKSHVYGLRVDIKDKGFAVIARKADLYLRLKESFAQKKAVLDCCFLDVRFEVAKTSEEGISTQALLAVPFKSNWNYQSLVFTVLYDIRHFAIHAFKAVSPNILLEGEGEYGIYSGDVTARLKLAFSPEISNNVLGDFKDFLLVPEDNGWYGSTINVESNLRNKTFAVNSDRLDIKIHAE